MKRSSRFVDTVRAGVGLGLTAKVLLVSATQPDQALLVKFMLLVHIAPSSPSTTACRMLFRTPQVSGPNKPPWPVSHADQAPETKLLCQSWWSAPATTISTMPGPDEQRAGAPDPEPDSDCQLSTKEPDSASVQYNVPSFPKMT